MTADRGGPPLLQADHVSVEFPVRSGRRAPKVHAVSDVSLVLERGDSFGLVGESGGGKSTLGNALTRMVLPTSGTVRYEGADLSTMSSAELRQYRRRVQIVFQDPNSSLNPRARVGDIIAEPLVIHRLADKAGRRARVQELLGLVGLDPASADRLPSEFSGGQRQRIGIARALAVQPEFVSLDEPVSALDVNVQAQVLNLLMDLRERLGLTFLFISHDLSAVRHLCTRVGIMYLGELVETGSASKIYAAPRHPYTRALLSAVPSTRPATGTGSERIILDGDIPSPVDPPSGCRFHTRCWLYERLGQPERCRTTPVALSAVETDHQVACHFSDQLADDVTRPAAPVTGGDVR